MDLYFLGNSDVPAVPIALGGLGAMATVGFLLAARWGRRLAAPLQFLAAMAATWLALCASYVIAPPDATFAAYLASGTLATEILAVAGLVYYIASLFTYPAAAYSWRQSSVLLAGLTLMGSAFVRAAYQPAISLAVEAPIALVFTATVWRFRAELLVYLSLLAVALVVVLAARKPWAGGADGQTPFWVASTASGVSLAMVFVAALMSLLPRQEFNVKWYRQGLLIVPVATATLAAMAAGFLAAWYGPTWHTVWAVTVWWAVLLVSSIGLRLPDLFGFSSVGAALAAVTVFAVLGGSTPGVYGGRYSSLLLGIALGAALLAALLKFLLTRLPWSGFPRALYLVAAAIAVAALAVEPLGTTAEFLGLDLLAAAGVLALAHLHRAPAWVNYLVAGLITAGVAPLVHLSPGADRILWHHRFILVTALAAVAWLIVSLALRELLRHTASDRTARRQTLPFTILGMGTTGVLAGYLAFWQWTAYALFLTGGRQEDKARVLEQLGPDWGLAGWAAVLLAWGLSMWLVRHTARTFLFYLFGISAVIYLGLFSHTADLYGYLIYAVAGYGASHLLVYLYEEKFMVLLSRTCALYREERRASTTIFTLAVISCFAGAVLAALRLGTLPSLVMLSVMATVFLAWSFIWLRGEMLYPAVLMVTLTTLSIWHNLAHPVVWDAGRLALNSGILLISALAWLGIGTGLHPIRAEVFQLASPARACSVLLAVAGTGFAGAMAVSPIFANPIWRQPRSLWDWTLGLSALGLAAGYFAWARFAFGRRFFTLMSGLALLLLGLYTGIYIGVRL
jgi:hypothetical protein